MQKVTIVGSGPAAAAAAIALGSDPRFAVEILDIGLRLESRRGALLAGVADSRPETWPEDVLDELSRHPAADVKGELPKKQVFGSDFPFRDAGQLQSLTARAGGNDRAVSGAFGGFSNAWGAQIMPFSRPTLDAWPVGYDAMVPHYRAMLERIPFAAVEDDYDEWFPLLAPAEPLPPVAPGAAAVLRRYAERRASVRRRGVTMGLARLAFKASECIACGLCLTGCPYGLIYSSSQTLAPLIDDGTISYRDGVLVLRVGEDEQGCWIEARNLESGALETLRTDRVLLACGGLGTTRIVLNSIRPDVRQLSLKESVQVVVPFVSARGQADPRLQPGFTLNQFNMLIEYGRAGLDLAQFHLYPYNPGFEDALPRALRASETLSAAALRRVTAGLGYLPSWASPAVKLNVDAGQADGLPAVQLSTRPNETTRRTVRSVVARMLAVAPALDLWPVVPSLRLSGPAKSYHFGGSFPHVAGTPRPGECETDQLGRPAEWSRVHMVDASVFPTVAATTFTLTVMANAHRIVDRIRLGAT